MKRMFVLILVLMFFGCGGEDKPTTPVIDPDPPATPRDHSIAVTYNVSYRGWVIIDGFRTDDAFSGETLCGATKLDNWTAFGVEVCAGVAATNVPPCTSLRVDLFVRVDGITGTGTVCSQ